MHLLVAAGRTERLALTGRRIQGVQTFVLHEFRSAATGWFTQQDSTVSNSLHYTGKVNMLTRKSCSREENKASPRLIPTCESIHTVNKEVRAFQKLLHKQTRWLESKKKCRLFRLCRCSKDNASPNLRLTVSLLTCHMPQKWNFSF